MNPVNPHIHPENIRCIVFDFGFTLSPDLYFKVAPPECPNFQELFQQHIFSQNELVDDWMRAACTTRDIAEIMAPFTGMPAARVAAFMELGCQDLSFNQAVLDFALRQREEGKKTAIVTGNMDVFGKVVVPHLRLNEKFDVIVNSFDYREIDKTVLWPRAFEQLGGGMGYKHSLLIEDSERNVAKFRRNGGQAYRYEDDARFTAWLRAAGW